MADHLAEEEQAFRFAAALLTGFAILTFACRPRACTAS
jgi:hypothetical protein